MVNVLLPALATLALAGEPRVVAIGDVHGAYDRFTKLLHESKLVDEKLHWSGGKSVFVQTGDILDRASGSRRVLEILMRLEGEARKAGGRVVSLLGNHEVLNLVGDLRYTTAEEFATYAAEESPETWAKSVKAIREFCLAAKPLLRSDYFPLLLGDYQFDRFETHFPRGYFRHRELFTRDGKYGKWLLARPALARVGRSLFLHGGISPRYSRTPRAELNKRFAKDLADYFELVDALVKLKVFHPLLGSEVLRGLIEAEEKTRRVAPELAPLFRRWHELQDGPVFAEDSLVWYRGLAQLSESALRFTVRAILETQDVDRIVIGHTQPADLRVLARFDAAVILIDTGMNREYYKGHAEALEITDDGKDLQVRELVD